MKTHSHIIVRWSKHHGDTNGSHDASVHRFPVNRWVGYLITIPLALIGVAFAVFFFSAFLALFLIAGSALGIWMWWIRRQTSTDRESSTLEGIYQVVDETQISDRTSAEAGDNNSLHR